MKIVFYWFTDDIYLSPVKLLEISNAACEKLFDESSGQGSVACLKNSMNYFANEIANIAQAIQEAESVISGSPAEKCEKVRNRWDVII